MPKSEENSERLNATRGGQEDYYFKSDHDGGDPASTRSKMSNQPTFIDDLANYKYIQYLFPRDKRHIKPIVDHIDFNRSHRQIIDIESTAYHKLKQTTD